MLWHLFIAAIWSPEGKELTSWHLFVMFIVILLLSHLVSWTGVVLDCIDPDPFCLSYLYILVNFITSTCNTNDNRDTAISTTDINDIIFYVKEI